MEMMFLLIFPLSFEIHYAMSCLPRVFDIVCQHNSHWCIEIVVSPFVALMSDQVQSLKNKGVNVVCIVNGENEKDEALIINGHFQVIFTSPEVLLTSRNWKDVAISLQ